MEEQITSVVEESEFDVFDAVPFKIPMMVFVDIEKPILKSQGTLNNQNNLKKKNKTKELTFPDFQTYYKISHQNSVVINTK